MFLIGTIKPIAEKKNINKNTVSGRVVGRVRNKTRFIFVGLVAVTKTLLKRKEKFIYTDFSNYLGRGKRISAIIEIANKKNHNKFKF